MKVTATSSNPALIRNPLVPAAATAVLGSGAGAGTISSINVTNGGSGYAFPPAVNLIGGGGSGAIATAVLDINGVVTKINVTPGSGYTSAPLVSIAPPASIATATATLAPARTRARWARSR